uniref:glutamate-5-semialdehyde dehydrogenase n=1 Tax=Noctiluca scintillans TaxID=2966 RepID=A0A7S1F920_NOCSC
MEDSAKKARAAAQALAAVSAEKKNAALVTLKRVLIERRSAIQEANALDRADAETALKEGKLSASLLKRLDLSDSKFDSLIAGIDDVITLPDPIGAVTYANRVSDGLDLYRVTCPIGVLLIIFEARPEAAVQISTLAIKSGNSLLLKGGKEASRSNSALIEAINIACTEVGLPDGCIQAVDSRSGVAELVKMDKYIDLVIPRGSNELVRSIKDSSRIAVLGHADGICSVYVDEHADLEKAVRVVVDSKTQYAAACNAMETLLVHEKVVEQFLPLLAKGLENHEGVRFKADPTCIPHLPANKTEAATDEDFEEEFLCFTMAVRMVPSADVAIDHINLHGSHHTDVIITEDKVVAEAFLQRVDSAGVFHNASSRFADGFRFGFGAEVGISTNRVHARGPVGLEGLVIYKYRLYGDGHTVADFGGKEPKRSFVHERIPDVHTVDSLGSR